MFWSTPEECAAKCLQLLQDEPRRQRLAMNGRRRCIQNHTTNEAVLAHILYNALRPEQAHLERVDPPLPIPTVLAPALSEAYRT